MRIPNIFKYYYKKRELKDWKNYNYNDSVDAQFVMIISDITNFDKNFINVWYASKIDSLEFNYFKFEYKKNYYELHNNSLNEITFDEIFKNQD